MRKVKNRVVCTLWDGHDLPGYSAGAYNPAHVGNLARNFARHLSDQTEIICMVDDVYRDGVRAIPEALASGGDLVRDYLLDPAFNIGGWSNVLQAFSPEFLDSLEMHDEERILLVGLDTVAMRNIDWLVAWDQAPVGLPPNPAHGKQALGVCDAIVQYNRDGASIVWDYYERIMKQKQEGVLLGEDLFIRNSFSEMQLLRRLWRDYEWNRIDWPAKRVISYKYHFARMGYNLNDADIVYFHGVPKPQDLNEDDPVRAEWEKGAHNGDDGECGCS